MKRLLLALCACCAISAAQAQYYMVPHTKAKSNPGGLNTDEEYPVGGTNPVGWTTLFTGSAATASSPAWSNTANIPFAFNFNGTPVTSFKVSSSGVLTFTTSATTVPGETNASLPDASIPDNSILVWGLKGTGGDFIATKTFGAAPNRQHWIHFNSYSHPGSASIFTYWSIVLEETTNKIYIVDQRSANGALSLTAGIQINGSTAFQVAGSPNLNALAGNDPTASDNTYYEFVFGTQPVRDLAMDKLITPTQLGLADAPFKFRGVVINYASAPVTSFTINYKVGNNPVVSTPVTNVNIPANGSFDITHQTPWNPGATGTFPVKFWASNINGGTDQSNANDTISKTIKVVDVARTVLHEVFTSSTCPPCLPGNANLHAIMDENPGVAVNIKYQQTYPANPLGTGPDPYSTVEARNRHTNYYGINSIPRMEVNGGWNQNANAYTPALMDQFHNAPANVKINATYSINSNKVTASATLMPNTSNSSSNLVAHLVITEKHTTQNARSNGETDFYDVMKKMMPNENGNAIPPLTANQPISVSQSYTITAADKVEHIDSLQVVVFVQDKVTKEVFNATMAQRVQMVGTSENAIAEKLQVFPNPSNGMVTVMVPQANADMVKMTVFNTLGQQVWTNSARTMTANDRVEIDLSGQARGIYFVNVQVGDKTIIEKVSLVK